MLTQEQTKQLDERGFVILEGALAAQETDELRQRAMTLVREEAAAGTGAIYLDDKAQRVWNLVNKGEIFEQAIQHPQVLGPMEYLLGEDCTLSSFTVNIIGPGASASNFHFDLPLSRLPLPRPNFALCANSMWFLDDFTVENGGTRCVPGSHLRLDQVPEPEGDYPETIQAQGPRGSIMITNGGIWHSSGANCSEGDRVALLGFFCRAVLKPQQDHLKIVSQEVVERATPTLKRLLGYDSQPNELS
jgi:ectoine hydroxylase-related dioxygenase (phytanoyl-CoA dioxygenase family)